MKKNILFFLANGIVTPFYIEQMSHTGYLPVVLACTGLFSGLASLYVGKLSDAVGTRNLLMPAILINVLSLAFMSTLAGQFMYGITATSIGLLINIETSERKESSGKKFGRLTFYIAMSNFVSILLGGYLSYWSVPIAVTLLCAMQAFMFFEIGRTNKLAQA